MSAERINFVAELYSAIPVFCKPSSDDKLNINPRIAFADINQICASVGTKVVPSIVTIHTEPSVLDNEGIVRIGTGSVKYAFTLVVVDALTYPVK